MKRKTIYLTCFVLALGPAACVFAADAEIPATGSSIVLDGTRDAAWFHVPQYQIGNVVAGTSSETDCSGTWQALWNSQSLYVFVDVNDETQVSDSSGKWDDDSIEVFVDIHNDKATSYAAGADDYQYRFAWDATDPAVGEDHGNTTAGIEFALLTTGTGYTLEAKFPWSILYQDAGVPSIGDLMGFEVQINDDDNGDARDNQLDWYSTTNDAWQNPSVMGTVVFVAGSGPVAVNPQPSDKATDVARDTALSWTPGEFAASHNVYFGTTFDDVNSADVGSPLLVSSGRDVNTYDPPGLLDYAQTYYWRVDEVNAAPDSTVFKGDVWSFTIEPLYYPIPNVNASTSLPTGAGAGEIEVTVDGSGLSDGQHSTDGTAMWVGDATAGGVIWIQYDFDRLYKVYEIHIWNYNGLYEGFLGFGLNDVTIDYMTDSGEWVTLGDFQLARATSRVTYAGETIEVGGLAMKAVRITVSNNHGVQMQYGLSEIRFLHKPVFARDPVPADGATEVDRAALLSWRAGREADSHQVYFGTDQGAVADGTAPADTAATNVYSPGVLTLGTDYYWRVDEVNEAETPSSWSSAVWNFTTQEYVAIDDFENYTDEPGGEIFNTWLDGYNVPANGSLVGHENPPYAERLVVHGGRQAMPFYYTNTGTTADSQIELAFATPQDWTAGGADSLSLYYRGEPTGFYPVSESNIIMNGIGADIWGTTDQFRFVYKQLTGNGSIIARIDRLDRTDEWAKAGVMIRQTLDSDSVLVDGIISADGNVGMQWRTGRAVDMGSPDTSNHSADGGATLPGWVKLTRTGNVFNVQYSADGVTWSDIVPEVADDPLSITLAMTDPVYIGLAVCSHTSVAVAGAEFSNITTTGAVTGAWQSAAIGLDQPAGNGIDTFYLTVEDNAGNKATLTNPDPYAVTTNTWQQWLVPLSDLSSEGVRTDSVEKLYLGIGDATAPSRNASGLLLIDDIAFGSPILGKVLVVHSYSRDYDWVEDVSAGIRDILEGVNVQLQFYYMDTKKRTDEAWKEESGRMALEKVADWQPDVVIAVDDNAQIYFASHLAGQETPLVVFCGVNAEPSAYGYPAENVTGILERPHFSSTLQQFKRILPSANRIAVISDNSVTSAGAIEYMKTQETEFDIVSWDLPSTFAEWQADITAACDNADAIAIYTYHTLRGETGSTSMDPQEVIEWTVSNSTVPIVGFFDFGVEDGWLYGSVESGYEHGSDAAQIALGLLSGESISEFPIKNATKEISMLNLTTAERLGIQIPQEIIDETDVVIGGK